jgi:hypothetical protein
MLVSRLEARGSKLDFFPTSSFANEIRYEHGRARLGVANDKRSTEMN